MTARRIISNIVGLTYEEEGTFGTDPASSPVALRCYNAKFVPGLEMLPAEYQKPEDMRGQDASIPGAEGGTLTFDVPIRGGEGSESPVMALMQHLGATIDTITGAATAIDSGTATTFVVTDAEAATAGFAVGQGVIHLSIAGTDSIRFIERLVAAAGDTTVTVNSAFTSTPTSGDGFDGSDTIVPTSGNPGKTFSFALYQGQGATDRLKWVISGCSGTWKLNTVEAGKVPVISFEFQADNWTDSEASTTLAADGLNAAGPILGDCFYVDGTGVDTRSIAFDPGLEMTVEAATCGANGRSNWIYTNSVAKLEISPLHDVDWITKLEGATTFDGNFTSYVTAERCWALWMPAAQLLTYALEDADGVQRASMDIQGMDPGKNADDANLPVWALMVAN